MRMGQIDFESKIRSKDNLREYFAINHNLFFPKESCFNTNFIKQVFSGEKLLLGLNESSPPDLAFIKDAHLFDKAALFKVVKNDFDLCKYIPDTENESRLNRDFLICVIFYKHRDKFDEMYENYVNLIRKNGTSSLVGKTLEIQLKFVESLNNFIPSKFEKKSKQFLKNLGCENKPGLLINNFELRNRNNQINNLRVNINNEQDLDVESESLVDRLLQNSRYGMKKKKKKSNIKENEIMIENNYEG